MRTRFYIERRRGEDGSLLTKDRPVYMTVAFHGKRVLLSSGKKLDMDWWDAGAQRVRPEHPESTLLNAWFESMREAAYLAWKAISISGHTDEKSFREAYKRLKPKYSMGFFDVFFEFMEDGSNRWSKSTYSKVRTFYKQLKEFELDEGTTLTFGIIDKGFLERLDKFYTRRGSNSTTVLKAINTLVWFLNWASNKGYNIYREYKDFYKGLKETGNADKYKEEVFLAWEELKAMLDLSLSEPREQRARDIFCLMCLTGLRYGEISNLKKEDILENRIIVRKQSSKTRIVPMNKFARKILARYENKYYRNNSALPVMSMVTLNKYIKSISAATGHSKSERLTAGAATATFLMNAIRLDIPVDVISSYTGVSQDKRIKVLKQQFAMEEMEKFDQMN